MIQDSINYYIFKPFFKIKTIKTLWDSIHDDALLPWWCRGRYGRIENVLKFKRMCVDAFLFKGFTIIGACSGLIIIPYELSKEFDIQSFKTWFFLLMYPVMFFGIKLVSTMMAEQYNELVYKRNTDRWLLYTKKRAHEITEAEFHRIFMSDPNKYRSAHTGDTALGIAHFNPLEREDWTPLTEPDNDPLLGEYLKWNRERNILESKRREWELEQKLMKSNKG